MSNPISNALFDLRFAIPEEILQKIFITLSPNQNLRAFSLSKPISLDTIIRETVIEPKVMKDCNLLGGVETTIPLENLIPERYDPFVVVYQIPKYLTQGRSITRALSVSYGQGSLFGQTSMGLRGSNSMLDAVGGVMAAQGPIPAISTAYTQLIGENTIMIQDNMAVPANAFLRCWLENDSVMAHLQPPSYVKFSKLVEYAVKAYIWTRAQVPMGSGFIQAGVELGVFKTIIDGYSDAQQNYEDYLNKTWRKVAFMNDYEASKRHLQAISGGRH